VLERDGCDLVELLEGALDGARRAVERTPQLLPALAAAGVVDAGGLGFSLLFDAWLHVIDGRALPSPDALPFATSPLTDIGAGCDGTESSLRYEVMFLLEAPDDAIPSFKERWGAVGDSIVVVGGGGQWNCHIHTDDVDAAIAAGSAAGRPTRVEVTDLVEQVHHRHPETEMTAGSRVRTGGPDPGASTVTGIVAVAQGEGVTELLHGLGVHEVVAGGQSMNPSTAEILDAVDRVRAPAVIVLPNNSNVVAVARQAATLSERPIVVVATRSVVAGLAALIAYDERASVDDNAAAMDRVLERVRVGEVTRAVRDSTAPSGPIARGDWLGLTDAGIVVVTSSAVDAATALASVLIDAGSSELLTILVGADATAEETDELRARLDVVHPEVEVEVHHGGQPLYPFLLGVE
jgi:DAK2 domain fusion protein YloV